MLSFCFCESQQHLVVHCVHLGPYIATLLICRYGLSESDDEDDGGSQVPMQEKTPIQTQAQPPKQAMGVTDKAVPAKQGYGFFDEDESMEDDSGSDQTGRQDNGLPNWNRSLLHQS